MMNILITLLIIIIGTAGILIYIFNYKPRSKARVKDLYAEGLDLIIAGKRKAAYQNFKDIIDEDSENIKAYLRLGQVLREGGNPLQALKIHKGLLYRKKMNHYDQLELHKNLALDYYDSDNSISSINELEAILKLDKSNEWAIGYLIKIYRETQEWTKAGEYLGKYQQLTAIIDKHKLALYKIQEGRSLIHKKKFNESRKTFEDSINICGDLAAAYYFIGNAYSAESEEAYQKSIQNELKVSSIESSSSEQIENARELLGKAIPMWIRYAELRPRQAWMVIHLLKDSLFALDRYSEIEDILKQILKIDKDNIEVIASLSEILSHRGEESEAIELIDSAIGQDPNSLIVKLIKMKHQAKKEKSGNEFLRGLDELIHFLVTDERFQIYKNTDTDPDIIWSYENSSDKQSILS